LVPIESAYATSYYSLIVTLDISPTIFGIGLHETCSTNRHGRYQIMKALPLAQYLGSFWWSKMAAWRLRHTIRYERRDWCGL